MIRIERDPEAASAGTYDLIVVGGGIYGAMLALESARCGLKPLLVERDDFGGATSWNSLRILHGGLRYLQHGDLRRLRESVGERRWFLEHFPDLAEPLPCLMPLYGTGLRRPSVMRVALAANAALTRHRNRGVREDRRLPAGRMLDVSETMEAFPSVDRQGLRGGALWFDAIMPSTPRLFIEILRWAVHCGAICLNYVEGTKLLLEAERVVGLEARDAETGRAPAFRAPVVVNCAGPWCRQVAAAFDRDVPSLFQPSLAFNLLLDREPLSDCALAVTPKRPGAQTYFLLPWKGRILAGTHHGTWTKDAEMLMPSDASVRGMLDDLNVAIPGFAAELGDVVRIHAGLLPAAAAGSDKLAVRERIVDHGTLGGPDGLFSVSGVKFTTARLVAEKTLRMMHVEQGVDRRRRAELARPIVCPPLARAALDEAVFRSGSADIATELKRMEKEEAVMHLDDLLLRRADWAGGPEHAAAIAVTVCDQLGWSKARTTPEVARFRRAVARSSPDWLRAAVTAGCG